MFRSWPIGLVLAFTAATSIVACQQLAATEKGLIPVPVADPPYRKAAENELAKLKSRFRVLPREVAFREAKKLGFMSPAELANAELGIELGIKRVRLSPLSKFKLEDDPKALLDVRPAFLYGLNVGTKVRSTLTVALRGDNKWGWKRRGQPSFFESFERLAPTGNAKSLVEIRGLNLYMLEAGTESAMTLIPISNPEVWGELGLTAEEERSAKEIFDRLAQEAAKVLDDAKKRGGGTFY